jgi:hypothetical protein
VRGAACLPLCCVCVFLPPRQGGSSPFYRSRRERITCAPRYLATWRGVACYAVEWAVVRTILAVILYPNSGGFEGRMAADGCGVF